MFLTGALNGLTAFYSSSFTPDEGAEVLKVDCVALVMVVFLKKDVKGCISVKSAKISLD